MKNKLLVLTFLFFLTSVFSQEVNILKIEFNVKGSLRYYNKLKTTSQLPKSNEEDIIQTLRADVVTNDASFSLLLQDYNNNGTFNDFRKTGRNFGSDGIFITDFKKNNSKILESSRRYITKNYPIIVNGISYRLKHIKKIKTYKYTADLIKENLNIFDIVNNKNGALIDSLPNVKLIAYKEQKVINLNKLIQKDKLLYLHFYDDKNADVQFFIESPILRQIRKSFPKLIIINIGVIDNKKRFDLYLRKNHINKKDIFLLENNDNQTLLKLGYNFKPNSDVLFNAKGKVIMSNVDASKLKKYLYKKRKETIDRN
jgi:hypothetical protein